LRELPAELWPGHASLLEVPTRKALAAAAQMNVIEFHTWNARWQDRQARSGDLRPGSRRRHNLGARQEAALLVRGMLDELRLQSWLKTSGGKGLHVVVPLAPRDDWDTVKGPFRRQSCSTWPR
jgi:bifunctional non-homologous end joining protein LigD